MIYVGGVIFSGTTSFFDRSVFPRFTRTDRVGSKPPLGTTFLSLTAIPYFARASEMGGIFSCALGCTSATVLHRAYTIALPCRLRLGFALSS
jgi:hypothetical protein